MIIPDKHEYNIDEFARLSRCFPKVSVYIFVNCLYLNASIYT